VSGLRQLHTPSDTAIYQVKRVLAELLRDLLGGRSFPKPVERSERTADAVRGSRERIRRDDGSLRSVMTTARRRPRRMASPLATR